MITDLLVRLNQLSRLLFRFSGDLIHLVFCSNQFCGGISGYRALVSLNTDFLYLTTNIIRSFSLFSDPDLDYFYSVSI